MHNHNTEQLKRIDSFDEIVVNTDVCAKSLADRDFRSFWCNVNKFNKLNMQTKVMVVVVREI